MAEDYSHFSHLAILGVGWAQRRGSSAPWGVGTWRPLWTTVSKRLESLAGSWRRLSPAHRLSQYRVQILRLSVPSAWNSKL